MKQIVVYRAGMMYHLWNGDVTSKFENVELLTKMHCLWISYYMFAVNFCPLFLYSHL